MRISCIAVFGFSEKEQKENEKSGRKPLFYFSILLGACPVMASDDKLAMKNFNNSDRRPTSFPREVEEQEDEPSEAKGDTNVPSL
ncbi:hypothetical protein A2U01_0017412 [Trifolium medium]|uniref:Uncharacterized protein n=1 Tax=Trifolium medium TaxID=97028 RepID=A0A392N9C3_9FABA|nr:hypothetical protein [Trifolium medium]